MKDKLEKLLESVEEIEVEDFVLDAEEIEFNLLPQVILRQAFQKFAAASIAQAKVAEPPKFTFRIPRKDYKSKVLEVAWGATEKDGGTRGKAITLGGQGKPPFYLFEETPPHKPIVAHDIFDVPFRLPASVKRNFGDAIKKPELWAKKQVEDFGAEAITLHLVSTDPLWSNRPTDKAMESVKAVLKAVDVPLIISGSGNYEKDVEVLSKAAEVCAGERVLISSVSPDMKDYARVVQACKEHGHLVLSLVSMDVPGMKQMNKKILKEGLPANQILMDPNTASLGYGIEYSITTMERIRLNALSGDKDLAMPMLAGVSNAWSAREAWMKDDYLGPKELRGPLWEAHTATMALLSGAEVFMMLHPGAIKIVKSIIDTLFSKDAKVDPKNYENWVRM
ncbi:MAG: CO dehydrogenase/acetyl-CoA synthase subunit delta [Candidatus Altiarchaeota archaeon]